jgi:hypothetical protein
MTRNDPESGLDVALLGQMRQTAINALIAAALMLFFGYRSWSAGLSATSDAPPLYALSVTAFVWTLLAGGGAMLLSALLCFSGLGFALIADAVMTGVVGALFILIGGVQLAYEGTANLTALLLVIFGVLFLRSAWMSWCMHRNAQVPPTAPSVSREPEGPISSDADRQQAMERLLSRKRMEAPVVPAVPAQAVIPEPLPVEPPTVPTPTPAPALAQPILPVDNEPAPDGFLAELGRGEEPERQ